MNNSRDNYERMWLIVFGLLVYWTISPKSRAAGNIRGV